MNGSAVRHRRATPYARAVVAIGLLSTWGLTAATGLLLWLAPTGPRSGRRELLLGLTKQSWGDVHFSLSLLAVAVTIVHLTIDWRAFRACVRHLTSTQRRPAIGG
jgi:hypothetical protein